MLDPLTSPHHLLKLACLQGAAVPTNTGEQPLNCNSVNRSRSAMCVFDGTPRLLHQEAKTLHHGLLQQTDRVVIGEIAAKLNTS